MIDVYQEKVFKDLTVGGGVCAEDSLSPTDAGRVDV
jgi:hypothetical protein